eukprot:283985-Hanusia_phi.AAC.1
MRIKQAVLCIERMHTLLGTNSQDNERLNLQKMTLRTKLRNLGGPAEVASLDAMVMQQNMQRILLQDKRS